MQTSHRKFPPVSLEDVCVHGEEEKKSVAREGEQTISNCVFILFSSFFYISAIAEEKTYPCTASHLLIIMAREERSYYYNWIENHILKNKDR